MGRIAVRSIGRMTVRAARDLWFTTDQRGVGRVTTSGEITMQPVEGSSRLLGIATAPDGSLWVADGETDELWHVKPSG